MARKGALEDMNKMIRDLNDNCHFKDFHQFIEALEENADCFQMARKFYEFEVKSGKKLAIPESFEPRVRSWVGGDKISYDKILKQKILQVYHKGTRTTTAFNPLRASRPLPKFPKDPKVFISNYLSQSRNSCDFCRYQNSTAKDEFGRFESNLAATASNVFKFNDFHSLVFPKRHDILNLRKEEFEEVFFLAQSWFQRVYETSPSHSKPHLIFDFGVKAGASQAHPHFHMFAGSDHYLGQFRALEEARTNYQNPSKYFSDYIQSHMNLGLGISIGKSAFVIVPLDSHKDHEFLIFASKLNSDWIHAFWIVFQTFTKELNQFCWSSAFVWPDLTLELENDLNFPALGRIASRGDCQTSLSDVSSLELYSMYNVNTNPFQTIQALKTTQKKNKKII